MAIDEGRNENINHPSRGLEFDFNPVMLNGLRSRTRSRNTFLILALFATLGGLFSAFISLGLVLGNQNTFLGLVINGPLIGKTIFWAVGALDVLAILATTPWVMGGAISGEREKDTFDLLTATSMPMGRIVFGKLASGFLFMLLLLVVSLPFQCISFALGGVTLAEVWINLLILLLTALTGCMTVLFFSSLFKNSGQALVWSIFSYTFLFFALPLAMLISSPLILSWNPTAGNSSLVALADILFVLLGWFVISINPLAAMAVSAGLWTNSQILFVYNVPLQTGGTLPMFSPWVLFSITSILLSLTLFWASTHFAGKPGK